MRYLFGALLALHVESKPLISLVHYLYCVFHLITSFTFVFIAPSHGQMRYFISIIKGRGKPVAGVPPQFLIFFIISN
ncbi:Uncharacterized protein TCM_024238 [Theobroma cacao]|uniref:Uncharacterized protein n=1 Tax=Theobroma cacao TaxID=3641 RepID=A0A061F339_THECC|nr:Uncharacterized protein TCM_024238 [Theobroma cacao]